VTNLALNFWVIKEAISNENNVYISGEI